MSEPRNKRQLIYGIVSVGLPFVTVGTVLLYQSLTHASFWNSLSADESAAGAMMGFAEIIQLFLFGLIACLVGFALACLSLLSRPKRLVARLVSYSGLVINGFALTVFVVAWFSNHL